MVSVKKRTFFFRMFLWTLRLQFSLSCRKVAAKLSYQKSFAPGPIAEKNDFFSEAVFFRKPAPPDNRKAVLNNLPKCFYQLSGRELLHKPRKDMIFWKKYFFREKFPLETSEVFVQNLAENFSLAFRKKFCNYFFSIQMFFPNRSPSTNCEVLATLLKLHAKS